MLVLENCRFLCHTIIETIQQIKARIKEIKEDEYSNSLTKVQVCAMFRAGDIGRNVLLKFIRLCMETASSRLLRAHKHLCEYLFSYKDCSDCKISVDKSLF